MKSLEEIRSIVDNMTDELFDKINKAENDYWELDSRTSRNGYKRMKYNLAKVGLSVEEWFVWCND